MSKIPFLGPIGLGKSHVQFSEICRKMGISDRDLKRVAASIWGRLGGSVSSDAKAAAARENGKKGGRPRKSGGVEGAKSPPLKRAAEQSPRPRKGTRPSKQKNRLT